MPKGLYSLSLLSVVLLGFFLPFLGHAQNPIYHLSVEVDVTSSCSSKAKNEALSLAKRKALYRLFSRLCEGQDIKVLLKKHKSKASLIKSFSVKGEERSATRYKATVVFDFHADRVRQHLKAHHIDFLETPQVHLVLLPILMKNGKLILWQEKDNIWYRAWLSQAQDQGVLKLTVPLSDLEDQMICPLKHLGELRKSMLQGLASRYGAEDVLLTVLSVNGEGASQTANVRYIPFAIKHIQSVHVKGPFAFEGGEPALNPLRDEIVATVQREWVAYQKSMQQEEGALTLVVHHKTYEDWQRVMAIMEACPEVTRHALKSLSKGESVVLLTGRFSPAMIKEKLELGGFFVDLERESVVVHTSKEKS